MTSKLRLIGLRTTLQLSCLPQRVLEGFDLFFCHLVLFSSLSPSPSSSRSFIYILPSARACWSSIFFFRRRMQKYTLPATQNAIKVRVNATHKRIFMVSSESDMLRSLVTGIGGVSGTSIVGWTSSVINYAPSAPFCKKKLMRNGDSRSVYHLSLLRSVRQSLFGQWTVKLALLGFSICLPLAS